MTLNLKALASLAAVASLGLTIGSLAVAADEVRTVRVQFEPGTSGATITDKITGYESVEYVLGAGEGQFLSVSLRPDNQSTGFNVYVPGKGPGDEALYNSDMGGSLEYSGQLSMSGDHTVSVFLNRNAARRGDTANYDIVFEITSDQASGGGGSDVSEAAVNACLDAVVRETSNNAVTVLSTEFSEANSLVMVGVGEQSAPWRCLVSNDGQVQEVMFDGEG